MAYITAAIIILIIILILIGILVVPFQISLELYRRNAVNSGHFKLSWLKIRFINRKFPSDKPKKKTKQKKGKRIDFNRIPKIIVLFGESLPYMARIFKAFLKSVSIKKISINPVIGLDSPADTAMISGYLWGLSSILNIIPNMCLTVQPDFHNERLEGSLVMDVKLRLLWITIESIRAFTKKPVRSLLGELRAMRG